jgi:hypothetical protein
MEGWFPRSRGELTRQRIAMPDCARTESSDRATRRGSAAARPEPRAPRLNSRPSSQNRSRRRDRRICGDREIASCAPTRWKEIQRRCGFRSRATSMLSGRLWAQAHWARSPQILVGVVTRRASRASKTVLPTAAVRTLLRNPGSVQAAGEARRRKRVSRLREGHEQRGGASLPTSAACRERKARSGGGVSRRPL